MHSLTLLKLRNLSIAITSFPKSLAADGTSCVLPRLGIGANKLETLSDFRVATQ